MWVRRLVTGDRSTKERLARSLCSRLTEATSPMRLQPWKHKKLSKR